MRVLIASPDGLARRTLAALVESGGHDTITAGSAEEAWAVLSAAEPPPLALLERSLPGTDAITLCTRLRDRADTPYVYVVVIYPAADAEEALAALEVGADDVLARPLNPTLFRLRLRAAEHVIALRQDFRVSRQILEYKSSHDALTGTWNRTEVLGMLERELARGAREGSPVSVIMMDVDHFKNVNDTYGHLAGDEALRQITARIMRSLRPYDIIGRYGGEEFLLVLGGCSGRNALALAERVRERVAAEPLMLAEGPVTATLSMGVATWNCTEHRDLEALLRAADAALYQAKRLGRNRVEAEWHCAGTLTAGDAA